MISHLLYADDTIIFTNGSKTSLINLMDFLRKYQDCSCQKINFGKSSFYVSYKISANRLHMIQHYTGFSRGSLSFKYLGCPIYKGISKVSYFEEIINKFKDRIAGWQGKMLFAGGKVVLINHVLTSLPIHLMDVFDMPKICIKRMESHMNQFLWGSTENNK